jgi:hypothetical protein
VDAPGPETTLDPSDLDALGVMGDVLLALRTHAATTGQAAIATIAAPQGWHRVVVTAQPGGHTVLVVRFADLTPSRATNVGRWVGERGWQTAEDRRGASRTLPPGTDATSAAMEVLAVLTAGGAPASPRRVSAADASGAGVPLEGPPPG